MFDLIPGDRRPRIRNRKSNSPSDRFFNALSSNLLDDFLDFNSVDFKTDIKETEQEYLIEAELPGLEKEDISVEVDGDYLTISGDNTQTIEDEQEDYIRKERRVTSFQRSFRIDNVKDDQIEAEYNNGILELTLPKEEPGKTETKRTIDIN